MLNLQKFIFEHENWRELLAAKPYCIKIVEDGNLVLFKYSQIDSDFFNPIVQECRGIILEKDSWQVVAYAFRKFGNFGEAYVDEIDWESAVVETKEDGSLIKVYFYDGEWRVGTNGTIFAENAELNAGPYKNFRQLFDAAAEKCGLDFSRLNRYYTYVFELCSSFNQIVCPQSEMRLIHIGTRNNRTFQEVETDIGIPHPQRYALSSLEDCIAMAKTFDFTKEGFVVKDKNYNRIKVKSEDYVRVHRLANNGSMTKERAIELIRANELDEFFTYFPQYREYIERIKVEISTLSRIADDVISAARLIKEHSSSRAEFAARVSGLSSLGKAVSFLAYDEKIECGDQYIASLTTKKLAKLMSVGA
jgi:hypothetical protein